MKAHKMVNTVRNIFFAAGILGLGACAKDTGNRAYYQEQMQQAQLNAAKAVSQVRGVSRGGTFARGATNANIAMGWAPTANCFQKPSVEQEMNDCIRLADSAQTYNMKVTVMYQCLVSITQAYDPVMAYTYRNLSTVGMSPGQQAWQYNAYYRVPPTNYYNYEDYNNYSNRNSGGIFSWLNNYLSNGILKSIQF